MRSVPHGVIPKLVGVFKRRDDPGQPFQMWSYNLHGPGVERVRVRGADEDGRPVVYFQCLGRDGKVSGSVVVKTFDAAVAL